MGGQFVPTDQSRESLKPKEQEKDEVIEEEEQEEDEGERERKVEEQGNRAGVTETPCCGPPIPAPSPPQQNSTSTQPAAEEAHVMERSEGWKETSPSFPAAPLSTQEEVATADPPAPPSDAVTEAPNDEDGEDEGEEEVEVLQKEKEEEERYSECSSIQDWIPDWEDEEEGFSEWSCVWLGVQFVPTDRSRESLKRKEQEKDEVIEEEEQEEEEGERERKVEEQGNGQELQSLLAMVPPITPPSLHLFLPSKTPPLPSMQPKRLM